MKDIVHTIKAKLLEVQQTEGISILLAVESGSRAWGFPSEDSDYDVRFVYCHPFEHYLSIDLEQTPDVIERPIENNIDLSGWDIRKALQLFRKSNPPILEWIQSPIVYLEYSNFANQVRSLLPRIYSPKASFYHYLHMAQGNLRDYLRGETVWQKKYFYVLRPLLAILWIQSGRGAVPMEFQTLLDATVQPGPVRDAILNLLQLKKSGKELDYGPRIAIISDFVETELSRLSDGQISINSSLTSVSELNKVMIDTLHEAWSQPSARLTSRSSPEGILDSATS